MKNFTLTATLADRSTTIPIRARSAFMAKVLASIEIAKQHVSDKRFEKGEIVLKSPEGKQVMLIKAEE